MNIRVNRYQKAPAAGYEGAIEPETTLETPHPCYPRWVLYWRADGSATLFVDRESDGSVKGHGIELPANATVAQRCRELQGELLRESRSRNGIESDLGLWSKFKQALVGLWREYPDLRPPN